MLAAGTSLGPYKILAPLGAGGMGEVYRAHDSRLGRDVAIKVLPSHLAATPEVRARFEREARTISQLNHPHICTLYDVGHQDGTDYLVMELLEGETLSHRLERGALPTVELLRLAIGIASALDAAHRRGVVHRDLKPGNVMLTPAGAKLLDFGLARPSLPGRGPTALSESPTVSRPLTGEGTIVGTFQYMAPEQLEGKEADTRSDLWALGCVLYEMATGKKAFEAKSQASLIAAIMDREPPPLSTLAPLAPPALERVVKQCLAKDPEQRWQTARDLAHELEWIQQDSTGNAVSAAAAATATPRAPAGRRRLVLWSAGAVVVVLAGAAALLFPGRSPRLNPAMTVRPLPLPFVEIGYPGMSSDGKWIALPANDGEHGWGIYFMNLGGGGAREIVPADPVNMFGYADVSPDGSLIAYMAFNWMSLLHIMIVPSLGGEPRLLASPGANPHWTPDGQRVGYQLTGSLLHARRQEIWSVRADGSDRRLELVDSLSDGSNRQTFAWSPDGREIVWTRGFDDERYNELVVRTLATGAERQLTRDRAIIDEVWWTRQDEIVFSSNRTGNTNLWMIGSSGGRATQITKGTGPDVGMRVSADGKTLLCLQMQALASNAWIGNLDAGAANQVTHDDRPLGTPSLWSGGSKVLVPALDPDPLLATGRLEVMDRQGGQRRTLLSGLIIPAGAAWSPDGGSIAFCALPATSRSQDSIAVFVADSSGAGSRRIGTGSFAEWVDDSTLVTQRTFRSSLVSARDGAVLAESADSTFEHPMPDGRVLVMDLRQGRKGWWVREAGPSSSARLIAPLSVNAVATARDGSFLLCLPEAGKVIKLLVPSGRREPVPGTFPGLTGVLRGYGMSHPIRLSADGREFVYLRPAVSAKLVLIENLR